MAIKKGLNPKIMQAWIINPQRLCEITTLSPSTSLKWMGFSFIHLLLYEHFLFCFCFCFFTFFFFPQLPTLFPPGKGSFASLARVPVRHHYLCNFRLIERRMSIRWCSPCAFFFFILFHSFSSPYSQPSSLREKGPSLR